MTHDLPEAGPEWDVLEQYMNARESGDHNLCDELLAKNPDMDSLLRCLDVIDGLASMASKWGEPDSNSQGEEDVSPEDVLSWDDERSWEGLSGGEEIPSFGDEILKGLSDETHPYHSSSSGENERKATESSGGCKPNWGGPNLPCEFGDYILIEEIGRGGMGVVYKARQKGLDRLVAVKMILRTHLSSMIHVKRFLSEAKACAALHHPNIVHVHDAGYEYGQHFFVMEYIAGDSLAERIKAGPVDFEEAARLMAVIARGVGYLHREGVIHRDLKPSNILLDNSSEPFLTDFGLAKTRAGDDHTTTGTVVGTASYMSPEQASGSSRKAGPASDVYGLGAIFYELLTERPPFREATALDTLFKVITREPALPRQLNPKVPRALQLICMKCLNKSLDQRYSSADDLADDLERYLIGESLSIRPPTLYQRSARWVRREPALAGRLAVLAGFATIEFVNYSFHGVDWAFHRQIVLIMCIWVVCWIACQRLVRIPKIATYAHCLWGVIDAGMLLAALFVGNGAASALIVGFPLIIAGSGLWFRERFVWMTTGLMLACYGILLVDLYVRRTDMIEQFGIRYDRHVIFAVMLISLGGIISYLVHRISVLSRNCGPRQAGEGVSIR
jgi:eukaryotic-like serine/threonine-protein kinase